jgi:peroxiredoxin
VNNYPHYKAWQDRYADKDVVIVGVHTPETPGERDVERIKAQAAKHGLKFPIAVDNDKSNWDAWNNRYWPTVYVVDRRGRVRYGWEGELSYKGAPGEETVRKLIDALLLERP